MTTEETTPGRVVDGDDQGWYLSGDGYFHADYGFERGLDQPRTYTELLQVRSPLRPVEPVTDEDEGLAVATLIAAGPKAAGSLMVALYQLFARYSNTNHGRVLLAGREGSWESAGLPALAWEVGSRIAEKPARFDEHAVEVLTLMIDGWVSNPARYVEVAETLAYLFSQAADRLGGWDRAADRWLQPGRWQQTGSEQLCRYLMSTAAAITPEGWV